MEPFATPAEAAKDLVRSVNDLGFNYEVVRVRYQHEGNESSVDKVARNSYRPDFPVRGRIYEGDEWSHELSDDGDDPV